MAETTHVPSTETPIDRRTASVDALAELTAAWQAIEAARQHAYEYHRHAGLGDAHLTRAVAVLRMAGQHDLADAISHHLVGRGVAGERWTFQVDEDDDEFGHTLMTLEEQVRSRSRSA